MTDEKRVLLVTTREDLAADLLILELRRQGINYFRLNCDDFPSSACLSWKPFTEDRIFSINGQDISLANFKSVWYRRTPSPVLPDDIESEGLREFVVKETGAFLDGFWYTSNLFWINRPSKVQVAENKLVQLWLAKKIGLQIPRTIVTNNPRLAREFASQENSVIAKPISVGCVDLDGAKWGIYTHALSKQDLMKDGAVRISPLILQERIARKAEGRITAVGRKLFATQIFIEGEEGDTADWHLVDKKFVRYKKHKLPDELAALCLRMTKYLGLVYAAFDFIISSEGEYVFLEVNPSGQWGWIEQETGYPITKTLAELLRRGKS